MLTANELSVKQNATPPLIERSRGNGVASSDDLPKILTKTGTNSLFHSFMKFSHFLLFQSPIMFQL